MCKSGWTGPACSSQESMFLLWKQMGYEEILTRNAAQIQPISVTINETNPNVVITPQESGKFTISIQRIAELAGDRVVRSIYVPDVHFFIANTTFKSPSNIVYNYSATLENRASLNILVSFGSFSDLYWQLLWQIGSSTSSKNHGQHSSLLILSLTTLDTPSSYP